MNRKHHTTSKKVVVIRRCQTDFPQILNRIPLSSQRLCEGVALFGCEAQTPFANRVLSKATLLKVLKPNAFAFIRVKKLLLIKLQRPFIDNIKRICQLFFLNHLFGNFSFFNGNIVFFGDIPQGFGITDVFVFHQKSHSVATFATAKTLENIADRINIERRRFFIVERTQATHIRPFSFEGHEIADNIFNADNGQYLLYGFLLNHSAKLAIRNDE